MQNDLYARRLSFQHNFGAASIPMQLRYYQEVTAYILAGPEELTVKPLTLIEADGNIEEAVITFESSDKHIDIALLQANTPHPPVFVHNYFRGTLLGWLGISLTSINPWFLPALPLVLYKAYKEFTHVATATHIPWSNSKQCTRKPRSSHCRAVQLKEGRISNKAILVPLRATRRALSKYSTALHHRIY
jgi:hypothetical protein